MTKYDEDDEYDEDILLNTYTCEDLAVFIQEELMEIYSLLNKILVEEIKNEVEIETYREMKTIV